MVEMSPMTHVFLLLSVTILPLFELIGGLRAVGIGSAKRKKEQISLAHALFTISMETAALVSAIVFYWAVWQRGAFRVGLPFYGMGHVLLFAPMMWFPHQTYLQTRLVLPFLPMPKPFPDKYKWVFFVPRAAHCAITSIIIISIYLYLWG